MSQTKLPYDNLSKFWKPKHFQVLYTCFKFDFIKPIVIHILLIPYLFLNVQGRKIQQAPICQR